tara:strand:+ start:234 stop:959 length:726 start_codon:yes stop_codon:yes gene_type:complete
MIKLPNTETSNSIKNIIKNMNEHMLTCDLIVKSQQFLKKSEPITLHKVIKKNEIFYPDYVDKLFWCFYIMHYNLDKFKQIDQKVFSIENETKIKLVELIRKNGDDLKKLKRDYKKAELDLIGCPFISFNTFETLCVLFKLNVIIIKDKCFYNIKFSDSKPFIIHYNDRKVGIELDITNEKINKIKCDLYEINKWDKPILGISSYKLSELQDICNKLKITIQDKNGKNLTKQKLYQQILEYL